MKKKKKRDKYSLRAEKGGTSSSPHPLPPQDLPLVEV